MDSKMNPHMNRYLQDNLKTFRNMFGGELPSAMLKKEQEARDRARAKAKVPTGGTESDAGPSRLRPPLVLQRENCPINPGAASRKGVRKYVMDSLDDDLMNPELAKYFQKIPNNKVSRKEKENDKPYVTKKIPVAAESTRMVTRSKSGVGVKPGGEGRAKISCNLREPVMKSGIFRRGVASKNIRVPRGLALKTNCPIPEFKLSEIMHSPVRVSALDLADETIPNSQDEIICSKKSDIHANDNNNQSVLSCNKNENENGSDEKVTRNDNENDYRLIGESYPSSNVGIDDGVEAVGGGDGHHSSMLQTSSSVNNDEMDLDLVHELNESILLANQINPTYPHAMNPKFRQHFELDHDRDQPLLQASPSPPPSSSSYVTANEIRHDHIEFDSSSRRMPFSRPFRLP